MFFQPIHFSNYSATAVDVFAPGESIHTTDLYNEYTSVSGSAFASSMVAGVVALMLSANYNLTPSEIRYMISYGGDYVSSLSGKSVYGTRLNAYTALQYANGHNPSTVSVGDGGHYVSCSHCGYSEIIEHELYMNYEAAEDYIVECWDCTYSVSCWESPEYGYMNIYNHYVSCPDGCYDFIEAHDWRSYDTTRYICFDCGELKLKSEVDSAYFTN